MSNLDQQVAAFLEKAAKEQGAAWQTADHEAVAANVREILKTKTEYLNALNDDYTAYNDKLTDLIIAETKLMEETEKCAHFIDQRVLWINSSAPISTADLQRANQAFWWLVGPAAWADIGKTLAADAARNPALSVFVLGIFILLFYWRFRFHVRIVKIGEKAARGNCCRFWPTLETALLTVLVAVGWPGLVQYVGWRLTVAAGDSTLCLALGHGLTETARVFFALELLRLICCPRGLAEAHFGGSVGASKLIRSNIRWFSAPALLLMGVAVTMAWQDNNDWDASLGRIAFVAALLCFSLALYRVLRPSSALIQAMIAVRRDGWLERFRYVWYPLCVFTPVALALMAAAGYHYTSRQLVIRLILTVYVLVGGLVCRALLLRWVLVNQRSLAIEQAKKRRAAAQGESKNAVNDEKLPNAAVSERDLATINVQTKRLIEYSLSVAAALVIWCAWVDVLPALDAINIPIGTYDTDNASNAAAPNNGATTTPTVAISTAAITATAAQEVSNGDAEKTKMSDHRIKLAHLFLAIIIFATTAIAAKNIPGLLEMAVLQHLPVDAGARYAIATVSRYIITIAGILWGCGILGIGWSKVQWLVAAMGLGLGFGLQEIFANFISGLIILLERPIRVGDVVTIGAVTGVVSRIHMRATTIIDGDRKELIIPNKEFITGQVLNWTLTDPVNRVAINVGVAYGSDTAQTAKILQKIAHDHPQVLDDPSPNVSLESFGNSSLNFVLRCFLPNLEKRGTVITDLHIAIERELRKAGIEMSYPHHDVNLRVVDPISPALQSVIAGGNPAWPTGTKAKTSERAA